jgi:hypothetical protein
LRILQEQAPEDWRHLIGLKKEYPIGKMLSDTIGFLLYSFTNKCYTVLEMLKINIKCD